MRAAGTAGERRGSVALIAVGCRVNQAEVEGLAASLAAAGWSAAHDPGRADVVVVNTCAVTSGADSDGRKLVRRIHRANPRARIVVTGCQAEREAPALGALPGVRLVVGNAAKHRIPDWLERFPGGRRPESSSLPRSVEVERPPVHELRDLVPLPVSLEGSRTSRPLVKIQDGCDRGCAFCVIPGTRGASRSLGEVEVIEQLSRIGDAGFGEAVLTGIDLGSWGEDRPGSGGLPALLDRIDRERPVTRLRLSSLDPRDLSADLAERVASYRWICPHLHLSLQTGSPDVHRRMGRGRWPEGLEERVHALASARPELALGLDLLTAFPGETDADHRATCDWVREQPVSYTHVFPYSPRPGTPAARWSPPGGESVSAPAAVALSDARARELRELGARLRLAFHQRHVGSEQELVVEAPAPDGGSAVRGTTANFIPVEAACSEPRAPGALVRVRLTAAEPRGCRGTIP